jgi:hypothetical protein
MSFLFTREMTGAGVLLPMRIRFPSSGEGGLPCVVRDGSRLRELGMHLEGKGAGAFLRSVEMACVRAWYYCRMKKLTITEFARLGGKARAQKLSAERRREIASQGGKKGGRSRPAKIDNGT